MRQVILPVKAYEPLKLELERKDMVLQSALAEHLRASLNAFANHLIRIWINDGRDEELIGYLMAHHMQTEESPGTLFRGNTLVTKVMDQYMKFIAIDYLQDTVEHCIVDICDEKRSFEMDDSRGGRPAESARILKTHCQNICNSIFASVDRCPPPLRRVFGVLQQQAKKRFPGDAHVQYTSVSAFLFLRLFCPAIINPKLFNMMSEHPTDTLARNLTLVAKVIQNLANMAEFGQKEAFMQPMNEFIMLNRGKMQTFLNSVSSSTRGEHEVKVASASRDLAAVARMCSQTDKLETVLDSYKVQSPLVSIIRALESKNNA
ncbi:uncharacterized protein MONBRDRAFT_17576 [Monosiga brevicollis MX1]|uniref:Ras-GAP domain-containing protein n=1 Tax=Monosiga brevicollis TaxID=81824 RepID=A9US96_MONBE|nr:uncharacterized protein MONBRDRAFT_17576 [Monosiga brevicollis MX1]EDQ91742.1 predicted protein [Monosiga brevicollis MX1]|eukprot:XP_001743028.1 hypothetical protein [Monosiga brevicollis MX1]